MSFECVTEWDRCFARASQILCWLLACSGSYQCQQNLWSHFSA